MTVDEAKAFTTSPTAVGLTVESAVEPTVDLTIDSTICYALRQLLNQIFIGFTELILLVIGVDLTVDSTVKSILELTSDLSLWLEKIVVK